MKKYRVTAEFVSSLLWAGYDRCPYCGNLGISCCHTEVDLVADTVDAVSEEAALTVIANDLIKRYESEGWAVGQYRWEVFEILFIVDPEKLHAWTHGLPIKGELT